MPFSLTSTGIHSGAAVLLRRRVFAISGSNRTQHAIATTANSNKPFARAFKPVQVKLVTVSKGNTSPGTRLVAKEWQEKIERYTKVTHILVKSNPTKAASTQVAVQAEGQKVAKQFTQQDYVVLLDERGKSMTSEGMAQLIAEAGDRNADNLVFCIGGPFGHSGDLRAQANKMVKLSDMVLNHQIAHVVLLEQIYRALTILRGEPYHH